MLRDEKISPKMTEKPKESNIAPKKKIHNFFLPYAEKMKKTEKVSMEPQPSTSKNEGQSLNTKKFLEKSIGKSNFCLGISLQDCILLKSSLSEFGTTFQIMG